MKKLLLAGYLASTLTFNYGAFAHESTTGYAGGGLRADTHAPIGVMGDHMHKTGEWMLSYRYMDMSMSGLRNGTDDISPEEAVTTIPNRFFGIPGQPATLRVIPSKMEMNMHMVGAMYAPTDTVTLMAMVNYQEKDMRMTVFQGGAGTNILGSSYASSKGFGDTKVSSHIRLYEDSMHHVHLNAGLSLPTGDITQEGRMLMPNGMFMNSRLAYGMQLGSGTYDLLPGITYTGLGKKWGWGAQYMATVRLGENDENYRLGNMQKANLWGSYLFHPAVNLSARLTGETTGTIDGQDSNIMGPSPAADPDNYGGDRISAGLGINTIFTNGPMKGHRFSAEITTPLYEDFNGPQLKRDTALTLGWSKAF